MELHTNSLILKTVTDQDIKEVARMWDFQNGPISIEEAQKAIAYMQGNHNKNKTGHIHHLCLAVYEKHKNVIIGWCGLDGENPGELHIFYAIDSKYRNKGFATQCAERLLAYAFDEAGVPFVNGCCDKENTASYKVMEKARMQKDGYAENGDPLFYMTKEIYHNAQ